MTRSFETFVVIDWSGQAVARPKGLAVAKALTGKTAPHLLNPETPWSRESILAGLEGYAADGADALIGLDLSPALPFVDEGAYFPGWPQSPPDAKSLWALVDASCDDPHLGCGGFLQGEVREHFRIQEVTGSRFGSGRGRLRACEHGQAAMGLSPSSCFNLVGAAQVGKSSLTGMRVLNRLREVVPVWPFDPIPKHGPLIVEIYTSLAAREAKLRKGLSKIRDGETLDKALDALGSKPHRPLKRYDDHATDAILTAAWLRVAASRPELWSPPAMTPHIAATEGWTFGVR